MCPVVIVAGVSLIDQSPARRAMPDASPAPVGPADAEREIGPAACDHFSERSLEDGASVTKPVVPVAKRGDAVFAGEASLIIAAVCKPEVIEAEFARDARLIVTRKAF